MMKKVVKAKGIPYLELEKVSDDRIVLKGQKLRVEWIDSYVLVWSGEEHPYRR